MDHIPGDTPNDIWAEVWEWWSGLANYEQRPAPPGEMKLGRIGELLGLLGNPHLGPKVIHITGTKGKGSTAAMVESVLRRAGKRTALFTSPHLSDVTERFQISGIPVTRLALAIAVGKVRRALDSQPLLFENHGPPTFFEVATAAAFLLFAQAGAEWVVLEVGLGGRLDSTNICAPSACVITTIGLDHTKILGGTIDLIAEEKAGIIKPGVPVISGVADPIAAKIVRDRALESGSEIWELGKEFDVSGNDSPWWEDHAPTPLATVQTPKGIHEKLPCPLVGAHQRSNLACAVAVLEILGPQIGWTKSNLLEGLKATRWPGRIEIVDRRPLVILDGAHNPDSAQCLAREIAPLSLRKKVVLVVGCSADKDLASILGPIAPLADCLVLTRYTIGTRAAPINLLRQSLPMGLTAKPLEEPDPRKAIQLAREWAGPDGVVVVTGSLFLVGELRDSRV